MNALSDAQMAASVREQVTAILDDPIANATIARWTLTPEELRHWVPSEMRDLNVASETVRAIEEERGLAHRPFWMYEPGHRNAAALKITGEYQDIVSKGTYLTSRLRGWERSGFAIWSYEQIASAAKSLRTIPQTVLQLSADFQDPLTGTDPVEIRRVLRHDAYLALVMGMKGLNVWSMAENRLNLTTHNEQFQAYASVAQDLTGDLDLQKVFLFGEPRQDLAIGVAIGTNEFQYTDSSGTSFTFDTLHYFNAALGADRYLFLVNSTEQVMDVSISGLPPNYLLDDLFAGTTTEMYQSAVTRRLDVLGVAALRFRALGSSAPVGSGSNAPPSVPEPSATILAALAGSGLMFARRRTDTRRTAS